MNLGESFDGLTLHPEDIEKLLNQNVLDNGTLKLQTKDWGLIKLSVVHAMKKILIDPSMGEERWKVRLPRKAEYHPYSLKERREFFRAPAVIQKGIVRTIGLCRMIGLMVDEKSFVRYSPLVKHDQAASSTKLKTPDAPFSTLSLALVEMEEPIDVVTDDLKKDFGGDRQKQTEVDPFAYLLKTKKLKEVHGIFQIGIESPEDTDL